MYLSMSSFRHLLAQCTCSSDTSCTLILLALGNGYIFKKWAMVRTVKFEYTSLSLYLSDFQQQQQLQNKINTYSLKWNTRVRCNSTFSFCKQVIQRWKSSLPCWVPTNYHPLSSNTARCYQRFTCGDCIKD